MRSEGIFMHADFRRMGEASALIHIGGLFVKRGKQERGLALLEKALKRLKKSNCSSLERNAHKLIAEVYEQIGEPTKSLRHYKEYLALNEKIESREAHYTTAVLQARANIETLEQERELYRRKVIQLAEEVEGKSRELTVMALHLVQKDELLSELKGTIASLGKREHNGIEEEASVLLRKIRDNAHHEEAWKMFERQLQQLHQGFMTSLSQHYPDLTPSELKICSLIKTGMNNKEISSLLNISTRTIDAHRQNIRKKLRLSNAANLGSFLAGM